MYRPPEKNVDELTTFLAEFSLFLTHIKNKYQSAIITGDYNIDLLHINTNKHCLDFF